MGLLLLMSQRSRSSICQSCALLPTSSSLSYLRTTSVPSWMARLALLPWMARSMASLTSLCQGPRAAGVLIASLRVQSAGLKPDHSAEVTCGATENRSATHCTRYHDLLCSTHVD